MYLYVFSHFLKFTVKSNSFFSFFLIKQKIILYVTFYCSNNLAAHPPPPPTDSCSSLYPVSVYVNNYTTKTSTYHWPIGFIQSGNFSATKFSLMQFAMEYVSNSTQLIKDISFELYA